MRATGMTVFCSIIALVIVACATGAPTPDESQNNRKGSTPDLLKKSDDEKRVSVEVARDRAKLTHNIYAATLVVIHHHYFRGDRSSVPARALEDVFSEIARLDNVKARWIAVNARPMSIDHRPQDDFEKRAAKAIAAGEHEYEIVEDGTYRRAEGISLMNRGCLRCHLEVGASGKTERYAGLVITIPVSDDR